MEIISSFKKFKQTLEPNYRVATVKEAEKLLEALKKESKYSDSELCPRSKDEVFTLKDGYLYDFGAISTFYPDIEIQFTLGVNKESFPEEKRAGVCLPLALLHACMREDEEEIKDLVLKQSVQATFEHDVRPENELQKHRIPKRGKEKGYFLVEDPDKRIRAVVATTDATYMYHYPGLWGSLSQEKNTAEALPPTEGEGSETEISPLGAQLALLQSYTVWPKRCGTALHFAAATGRKRVVGLLVGHEREIMRRMEQAPPGSYKMTTGQLAMKDHDGNNPLCCAAAAHNDNSEVVDLLLDANRCHPDLLSSTFLQGNNSEMAALMVAASKGHMGTFCCLLRYAVQKLQRSPALEILELYDGNIISSSPFFEQLGRNNFLHYCVQRAGTDEIQQILDLLQSGGQLEDWPVLACVMLQATNNLGITALEGALEKGNSGVCKKVLTDMDELISDGNMKFISACTDFICSRGERDGNGNNILHLYALGGGTKEVGELLIEWLDHSAKSWRKIPHFSMQSRQKKLLSLNTVEAMLNQLNCAGETPCITALKRGHRDAFRVLLHRWGEDLAKKYRNPATGDTFLHCYAKSEALTDGPDIMPLPGIVEKLINERNRQGHTPLMSALHYNSQQITRLKWILEQEGVQIEESDHVLHVYAYYCNDKEVGQSLISKLGTIKDKPVKTQMKEVASVSPEMYLLHGKPGRIMGSRGTDQPMRSAGSDSLEGIPASLKRSAGSNGRTQFKRTPTKLDEKGSKDTETGQPKSRSAGSKMLKGTPLMLALAGGNLHAYSAIKEGGESHQIAEADLLYSKGSDESIPMDDDSNNVLHWICRNRKISGSDLLQRFWNTLVAREVEAGPSGFGKSWIHARTEEQKETPLRVALKSGKTAASLWLLQKQSDIGSQADQGFTDDDKKAMLDSFLEGGSSHVQHENCLYLWEKLKEAYCTSPDLCEHADQVLEQTVLNAISSTSQEILQKVMRDAKSSFSAKPEVLNDEHANNVPEQSLLASTSTTSHETLQKSMEDAKEPYSKKFKILFDDRNLKFWQAYLENVSSLKNMQANIEMKRHMLMVKSLDKRQLFLMALRKGNFELLELAIQAQGYDNIGKEYDKDNYQGFLQNMLYGLTNDKILFFLIQKFQSNNWTSPILSWERIMKLLGKNKYEAVGAWTWAAKNLVERPNDEMVGPKDEMADAMLSNIQSIDEVLGSVMRELPNVLSSFVKRQNFKEEIKADNVGMSTSFSTVRELWEHLINAEESLLWEPKAASLESLLKAVQIDHPLLVSFLLFSSSGGESSTGLIRFDDTQLLRGIYDYSRRGLVQNVHAALWFMFEQSRSSKSLQEAAITKPITTDEVQGGRRAKPCPILIAFVQAICATQSFTSIAAFIKVLYFAQSCQAEGMADAEGKTSLHRACGSAETEDIAFLLTRMCPQLVDMATPGGVSPLMVAAECGSSETVKLLLPLTKRYLSSERDVDGRSVLSYAAESRLIPDKATKEEVMKLLLEYAKSKADELPLLTHDFSHAEMEYVVQNYRKAADSKLEHLLWLAYQKRNWFMVERLINEGADTRSLDAEFHFNLDLYGTKQLDQPSVKDTLGRAGLAKGIASLFLNPFAPLPITVGVMGSWGMGKSSIMRQIQMHIMMTLIERNLLPSKKDSSILSQRKIEKLQRATLKAMKELTSPQRKRNKTPLKIFRKKSSSPKEKDGKFWERVGNFVSDYRPECISLYKSLAAMSRQELVHKHSLGKHKRKFLMHEMPSCIMVDYNAWLYYGESDATSGLALTIMQELEECMTTAQWLSLCWHYASRLNPSFVFISIVLPILVVLLIGGWVVWILWKLLSIPSIANLEALKAFKYGSLPLSTGMATWVVLRNIVNFLTPMSSQILESANTSKEYKSKLGYHQKVIGDIKFFKGHLGRKVGLWWRVAGKIWNIVLGNKDNIPKTNTRKFHISSDKLRIIVFIDDLDRCSDPKYVLELLGATNLILTTCGINAVLGMDKDIVKDVLQKENAYDEVAVEKFLEKIINIPIDLCDPSGSETSIFLEDQLTFSKSKEEQPSSKTLSQKSSIFQREEIETNQENQCLFPQNETPQQQMDSRDIQHFESHVTVNLQGQLHSEQHSLSTPKDNNFFSSQQKDYEREQHSLSTPHDNNSFTSQQKGYIRENNVLVVQFPLSLTNYNDAEVRVFKFLQMKAKVEQKKPRNWKRLINYHQLIRSILLESQKKSLDNIFGWQQQLIVWLFVCYNWKEQMNEILQDWEKLIRASKMHPTKLSKLSLHQVITHHKEKKYGFEIIPQEWSDLEETLYGGYDIDVESIDIFQSYRLHCNIGHIGLATRDTNMSEKKNS